MTVYRIGSPGGSRREEALIGFERTPAKKSKSPHVHSYSNPVRSAPQELAALLPVTGHFGHPPSSRLVFAAGSDRAPIPHYQMCSNAQNRMTNQNSNDQSQNGNDDTTPAVLFGVGRWKSIPHYRLRDPAFCRIFQHMTTSSRTFKKMGRRKSRLVRTDSDRFRPIPTKTIRWRRLEVA